MSSAVNEASELRDQSGAQLQLHRRRRHGGATRCRRRTPLAYHRFVNMISLIQYTVSYDTRFGWSGPLKSLSLYNNNIGDAGAAAIANAIAVNASLKTLGCARFLTKPS